MGGIIDPNDGLPAGVTAEKMSLQKAERTLREIREATRNKHIMNLVDEYFRNKKRWASC